MSRSISNAFIAASFWGTFAATMFSAISSSECEEKTAYIFSYILMSLVVGWTCFMLCCIAVELKPANFPRATIPVFGMSSWGGVLLSACLEDDMEMSNCKRNLWIVVCVLFFGQLLSGLTFFVIYLYFKCLGTTKIPAEDAAVSLHPSIIVLT